MSIEDVLSEVTKLDPSQYQDRQDYLATVARALGDPKKVTGEQYDLLPDEVVDWHNKAAKAIKAKGTIPDFVAGMLEEVDDAEGDTVQSTEESSGEGSGEGDSEQSTPTDTEEAKPRKPAKAKAGKAEKPESKVNIDYTALTGEKDRYGVTKGTKTSMAVAMYEKGATTKQITAELGGRFYNILKQLVKDGHTVEKQEGGVWKLIHKDDVK